jgi:hypothetical protein
MCQTIFWLLRAGLSALARLSHILKWFVLLIEITSLVTAALHIAHASVVIQLGA